MFTIKFDTFLNIFWALNYSIKPDQKTWDLITNEVKKLAKKASITFDSNKKANTSIKTQSISNKKRSQMWKTQTT